MDQPSTQPDAESSDDPNPPKKPKTKKEIHVVSLPHDDDMIADEMAELFEEDQVTHKHGSAEPEGD
ncbi:hypothetical protein [Candidatus Nitronereus thalassa]|uniref:Uncharacterized protein n=1 Tax=Candidatus Nitronereus thalassa TaxID=3020898 RepID=A0ABU3K7C8_9BACT|nr:hypothetical protein [Candidatus Nitronereus thalassa]MDT7042275.1 hypothetical protein [Candidatus Nitronereus thalassa]